MCSSSHIRCLHAVFTHIDAGNQGKMSLSQQPPTFGTQRDNTLTLEARHGRYTIMKTSAEKGYPSRKDRRQVAIYFGTNENFSIRHFRAQSTTAVLILNQFSTLL